MQLNGKTVELSVTHSDVGLPKKVCIAHFPAGTAPPSLVIDLLRYNHDWDTSIVPLRQK
jgi:hypothetical protein